jgi:hypothetical protein
MGEHGRRSCTARTAGCASRFVRRRWVRGRSSAAQNVALSTQRARRVTEQMAE